MIGEEGEKKTREKAIDDLAKEVNRRRVRKDISDKTEKWEKADRERLEHEVDKDTERDDGGETRGISKKTRDEVDSGMDFLDRLERYSNNSKELVDNVEYKKLKKDMEKLHDKMKEVDKDSEEYKNLESQARQFQKKLKDIINRQANSSKPWKYYVVTSNEIIRPSNNFYQLKNAETIDQLAALERDNIELSEHTLSAFDTEAEAGAYVSSKIRELEKKYPEVKPPISIENYGVFDENRGMPKDIYDVDPEAKGFLFIHDDYSGKEVVQTGDKVQNKEIDGVVKIGKRDFAREKVDLRIFSEFIIYKSQNPIPFNDGKNKFYEKFLEIVYPDEYEALKKKREEGAEKAWDKVLAGMTSEIENERSYQKTEFAQRIDKEIDKLVKDGQIDVVIAILEPFFQKLKLTAEDIREENYAWDDFEEKLDIPDMKKILTAINPEAFKDFQDPEVDDGDVKILSNDEIEQLAQDDKEKGKKTSYHNGDRDDSETWGRGKRSNWDDYHANDDGDGSVYESEFRPEPNVAKRLVSELEDLFDRDGDVYINEEDDGIVVSVDPEDSYDDDYEYRRGQILADVNSFLEDFNRENGTDYEAEIESENSILIY